MDIAKVIYIGEDETIDKPTVIEDEWLIPKGWVVLDKNLSERPDLIYDSNRKIINILEHIQILDYSNKMEYSVSIVKTDSELIRNQEIIY
jgi:hypothetical protein